MKKTHRAALKPTAEQEALFGQHASYARFACNWALRGSSRPGLTWVNGCLKGRSGPDGTVSRG